MHSITSLAHLRRLLKSWLPRKVKGGKVLSHLSLAQGLSKRWGKVSERWGLKKKSVRRDSNPRSSDPQGKVVPNEPLPQFDSQM